MGKIKIECNKCKVIYERWPYEIKNYKNYKDYICLSCIRSQKIKNNCKKCNKEFFSRVKENKVFCSKSCSAIFNNKNRDKSFIINNKGKTKITSCKNCNKKIKINIYRCSTNSLCSFCRDIHSKKLKEKRLKTCKYETNLKKGFCKIHIKTCNGCKKYFVASHVKGNLERKTCSDKCKVFASVGVRKYQNGSRKPRFYFNKHQNKKILLESSWEVKIAKELDLMDIKWIRPDPISWYDEFKNKNRYYYPDFYIPSFNLYLDPKNPYCLNKDKHKLEVVSKKINLIFGDVDYIIKHIKNIDNFNVYNNISKCT